MNNTIWVLCLDNLPKYEWYIVKPDGTLFTDRFIESGPCPGRLGGVFALHKSEEEIFEWLRNNLKTLEELAGHQFIVTEGLLLSAGFNPAVFDFARIISAAMMAEAFGIFQDEEGALEWVNNVFPDENTFFVSANCSLCTRILRIPYTEKGRVHTCPACLRKISYRVN